MTIWRLVLLPRTAVVLDVNSRHVEAPLSIERNGLVNASMCAIEFDLDAVWFDAHAHIAATPRSNPHGFTATPESVLRENANQEKKSAKNSHSLNMKYFTGMNNSRIRRNSLLHNHRRVFARSVEKTPGHFRGQTDATV
jgi:hypothetical protein